MLFPFFVLLIQFGCAVPEPLYRICIITKCPSISPRLLVLSSSGDSACQYMNYMNAFFTAQVRQVDPISLLSWLFLTSEYHQKSWFLNILFQKNFKSFDYFRIV